MLSDLESRFAQRRIVAEVFLRPFFPSQNKPPIRPCQNNGLPKAKNQSVRMASLLQDDWTSELHEVILVFHASRTSQPRTLARHIDTQPPWSGACFCAFNSHYNSFVPPIWPCTPRGLRLRLNIGISTGKTSASPPLGTWTAAANCCEL